MPAINDVMLISMSYDGESGGSKSHLLQGPGIQPGNDSITTLESIISKIIGVLTIVATIFFVIQIILAGYSIISTSGDTKDLDTAKKKLTFGVIGLAIVVAAYGLGALITGLLGIENVFSLKTILQPI